VSSLQITAINEYLKRPFLRGIDVFTDTQFQKSQYYLHDCSKFS